MAKRILIVYCHPKSSSLNHSIKEAVVRVLAKSRAEIKIHDLYKEKFQPILFDRDENNGDPNIITMHEDIRWAEHIVFITPMWWAHLPAMLKGYFDRVFTEGFSFEYNQAGIPEGLLQGRRGLLLVTCDTPPLILRISGKTMGLKSVISGILKLCGIREVRYTLFGSVLTSTEGKRKTWISKAEKIGERLGSPDGLIRRFRKAAGALVKAIRWPLYSFVIGLILLGASMGASFLGKFDWVGFLVAALIGLFAHAAVSLSNEVVDEPIDRVNKNRTMFSGGTGLLAKGRITKSLLTSGWIASAVLALLASAAMVLLFQYHWLLILGLSLALFLGLEYSLPPFRLSKLGLGELAAFIAYGVPLMVVGLVLQSQNREIVVQILSQYRFYLVALPVSLGVTATLFLTQIPDSDADRQYGKQSVSVMLGPKNVLKLTALLLLLCIVSFGVAVALRVLPLGFGLAAGILPFLTAVVIVANLDAYEIPAGMKMINIMGMSVTNAVACAVIPAIYHLVKI